MKVRKYFEFGRSVRAAATRWRSRAANVPTVKRSSEDTKSIGKTLNVKPAGEWCAGWSREDAGSLPGRQAFPACEATAAEEGGDKIKYEKMWAEL